MKKGLVIMLVCSSLIVSCTFGDKYSCDKEIDLWAHQNQEFFESAPRSTIVSLPFNLQHAAYVSLSAERKYELWMTKYQYLQDSDELSLDEKLAIKSLFDRLSVDVYDSPRKIRKTESFAKEWADSMIEEFGWDNEKLFYAVCTWMTRDEYNKSILTLLSSKDNPPGQENCTCIYSIGCGTGLYCQKVSCKQVIGCGVVGLGYCNGTCN